MRKSLKIKYQKLYNYFLRIQSLHFTCEHFNHDYGVSIVFNQVDINMISKIFRV